LPTPLGLTAPMPVMTTRRFTHPPRWPVWIVSKNYILDAALRPAVT
jgi:hypothetical protein